MDEEQKKIEKHRKENKKLLDYCQELVMLNYLYDENLITKDEKIAIRRDIEKSYGMKPTYGRFD